MFSSIKRKINRLLKKSQETVGRALEAHCKPTFGQSGTCASISDALACQVLSPRIAVELGREMQLFPHS